MTFKRKSFNDLILAITLMLSDTAIALSSDDAQLRIRVQAFGFSAEGSHDGVINNSLQIRVTLSGSILFPDLACELSVENSTIMIRNIQTCALATITVEGENIDWVSMPNAKISDVIVETNSAANGSRSIISFGERSFRYVLGDSNDWGTNGVIRLRLEKATPAFGVPTLSAALVLFGGFLLILIGVRKSS